MKKTPKQPKDGVSIQYRLENDEDFIVAPRHRNSLKQLLSDSSKGIDDKVIARVLNISQEEVETVYQSAILKLRSILLSGSED